MKFCSFIFSIFLMVVSVCACASTESSGANSKDMTSRIDDHLSKFKNYFSIHTSREHQAEQRAIEGALEAQRQNAKIAAGATPKETSNVAVTDVEKNAKNHNPKTP